jgi:hypothetical protein
MEPFQIVRMRRVNCTWTPLFLPKSGEVALCRENVCGRAAETTPGHRHGPLALDSVGNERFQLRLCDLAGVERVAVDVEAHRRFRVAEALREHLRHDPVVVPIVARHERELPQLVSFDADDSLRDRLDEAVAVRSGDPSADSSADLEWLLEDGDREAARDIAAMGLSSFG